MSEEKINYLTLVVPFEKAVPDIQIKEYFVLPGEIKITLSEKGIERKFSYKLK